MQQVIGNETPTLYPLDLYQLLNRSGDTMTTDRHPLPAQGPSRWIICENFRTPCDYGCAIDPRQWPLLRAAGDPGYSQ